MSDQTLPEQHRRTTQLEQRDLRANAMMAGETRARHELSAGVDTAWVRHYASGLVPSDEVTTALAIDNTGDVYVTGYSRSFPSGKDYITVKYDPFGAQ